MENITGLQLNAGFKVYCADIKTDGYILISLD